MSFEDFKKYHNANYHDGDSHFDDRHYKKSNGDDFDNSFVQDCFDHFEAGAASRHGEVDELHLKCSRDSQALHNVIEMEVNKRDELQKRIDEALDHAINHGGYDDLTHIIDILKGKKDE